MNKSKKAEKQLEKDREKFSLNQHEVHDFGKLVLSRMHKCYYGLKNDLDVIWTLEDDIELFKKLSIMVVRLQNGKKLKEE